MKWEDVGGLEDVKKSILDTVQVGSFISAAFLFDNLHKDCFFFLSGSKSMLDLVLQTAPSATQK